MPSKDDKRRGSEDGCYRLTLLADLDPPVTDKATPRSYRLAFYFDAPCDQEHDTYELEVGDCIRVFTRVCSTNRDRLAEVSIARLNIVAWTAARARPEQLFDTCFRNTGDSPDEQILTRGIVGDLLMTEPPALEGGCFYPEGAAALAERPSITFETTVPNRLELIKRGLFAFLVSLTLDVSGDLINYILDPEMDVGGDYPP